MCMYICICICICMYTYMYIYIYIYTHTHVYIQSVARSCKTGRDGARPPPDIRIYSPDRPPQLWCPAPSLSPGLDWGGPSI